MRADSLKRRLKRRGSAQSKSRMHKRSRRNREKLMRRLYERALRQRYLKQRGPKLSIEKPAKRGESSSLRQLENRNIGITLKNKEFRAEITKIDSACTTQVNLL